MAQLLHVQHAGHSRHTARLSNYALNTRGCQMQCSGLHIADADCIPCTRLSALSLRPTPASSRTQRPVRLYSGHMAQMHLLPALSFLGSIRVTLQNMSWTAYESILNTKQALSHKGHADCKLYINQ